MQDDKKLYVGNLPYTVTTQDLLKIFSEAGEVQEAIVISDKFSGRSKGFGFVTFANAEDAKKAVDSMNEKDVEGRKIVVNVARPREERN